MARKNIEARIEKIEQKMAMISVTPKINISVGDGNSGKLLGVRGSGDTINPILPGESEEDFFKRIFAPDSGVSVVFVIREKVSGAQPLQFSGKLQ